MKLLGLQEMAGRVHRWISKSGVGTGLLSRHLVGLWVFSTQGLERLPFKGMGKRPYPAQPADIWITSRRKVILHPGQQSACACAWLPRPGLLRGEPDGQGPRGETPEPGPVLSTQHVSLSSALQ